KDIRNCSPFESSSKLPSLDVRTYKQCWYANYTHEIGADANLIENSRCDLCEDIANDLQHHKTPKVRLMTMKSDTIVAPMDKSIKISQKKRNMFQENGHRFGMNNIDGDNGFDREKFCLQSSRESVNIKHTSKKDSGETYLPGNEINLNKVQNHSNVAIPQSNQQPMKPMETGQSTYVPTMGNMEMFKNRHEMSHL
ncbi:hypothetical protein MTR67_019200, partial [Solanum verrucosum]